MFFLYFHLNSNLLDRRADPYKMTTGLARKIDATAHLLQKHKFTYLLLTYLHVLLFFVD